MNLAVFTNNEWMRCITLDNPKKCRLIDTGAVIRLSKRHELSGIYEIDYRFITLPPRAILCGLGKIIPSSQKGVQWTVRACEIFKELINNKSLYACFLQKGIYPNTYYVFLTTRSKNGTKIHVNTAMCAFDCALTDELGLHHPVWPYDRPVKY